jgi:DNA-binding NarL/FixJ family response regulator
MADHLRQTSRTLTCLVIDRQLLVGELIVSMLRSIAGIGSVSLATSVSRGGVADADQRFDLVIWRVSESDGDSDAETIMRVVLSSHPAAAVIVMANSPEACALPAECRERDVTTLGRETTVESLRRSVERVVQHRLGTRPAADPAAVLRPRELEVFALIGEGMSTKRIAAALGISTFTVNAHRREIVAKLEVVGAELVRAAALNTQRGHAVGGAQTAARTQP